MLVKANQDGGIVHALQPIIVPEIIARCGMRWWNAATAHLVGSIVRSAVINHNVGNFGRVFDELYSAHPPSLKIVLRKLRAGHQHCAKFHHSRIARVISSLFRQTSDPLVNYVKDKVFGVKDGAPILADDHPVIIHLQKGDDRDAPLLAMKRLSHKPPWQAIRFCSSLKILKSRESPPANWKHSTTIRKRLLPF